MSVHFTRRQFLKGVAACSTVLLSGGLIGKVPFGETSLASIGYPKEARHYKKIDTKTVMCLLCPRRCVLADGNRSFCRVREAKGGKLYSLVYELPCAVHVDPIEKKPLYHMLPASKAFSIATAGCNLRCKFCQNWQISQESPENTSNRYLPCSGVVSEAARYGCRSIAYTYSEPTVFYEYVMDTAKIAKERGIKNVLVTGGFIDLLVQFGDPAVGSDVLVDTCIAYDAILSVGRGVVQRSEKNLLQ